MSRKIESSSTFEEKLIKLIPIEIIGTYVAIQDLVIGKIQPEIGLGVSAAILTALIPFYLRRFHSVRSKSQIIVSMISFIIWAFSISVIHFKNIIINPVWGSILIILWTVTIPVFNYNESEG
jgi:uncharacterized protein with PQ loop repeat